MSETSPFRIMNYVDVIPPNMLDKGFIMAPFSAMVYQPKKFRYPILLKKNNKYMWNLIIDYYYNDLRRLEVPMHYCIEKVVNEWDIHVGMAACNRSWWVKELCNLGLIPHEFINCKLICFCDDFYYDIPDERMYRRLWNNIFSSWMRTSGKDQRFIHYIDEILDWDLYNELYRTNKVPYLINRGTFFNRHIFDQARVYYRKY